MKTTQKVLGMLALAAAFVLVTAGCSKNDTASANSVAASQEQIAAEVARQVAEQVAAAQAAEKAAAEATAQAAEKAIAEAAAAVAQAAIAETSAPAPTAAAPVTPAPAAAPKYAIGAEGPGGGFVFSNSGGKYKEVLPWVYDFERYGAWNSAGLVNYNGYEWIPYGLLPIAELRVIYNQLQKTGKIDFGDVWIQSSTLASAPVSRLDRFPGAAIYYVGNGGAAGYDLRLHFSDGMEKIVKSDGSYSYTENGETVYISAPAQIVYREFR